jgi:hypothetical protein
MRTSAANGKVTAGFALAIVAGVLVLINSVVWFWTSNFTQAVFGGTLGMPFVVLGSIAVIFAIVILIGALLIYLYKKEYLGGIIVLIFSIFSLGVGGGFVIGSLLGILGSIVILLPK